MAVGVAIVLLLVAYLQLKKALASLDESRSEFSQNLRWMKSLLSDDASAATVPYTTASTPHVRFSRTSNDRIF